MAPAAATAPTTSSCSHRRSDVAHYQYLDHASLLNPPTSRSRSSSSSSPSTTPSPLALHRTPTRRPTAPLRITPSPPTLLALASSFQTLLDSQAPISSTHSAYSELLSVSHSSYPPSTLPISALTDLVQSNVTPSTSSTKSFSSVSTSLFDNEMAAVTTPGLDLLGILAEEVDWDPQGKGSPVDAQLAVLGQVQSRQQAKQRVWAGHFLDSLGLTSRRGSLAAVNQSDLPKPVKSLSSEYGQKAVKKEEDPLNTMTLTKRTALFYENLYERLCSGIVPRAYIYPRLGRKEHDHDANFAALALSISLLGLLGLTLPTPPASRSRKAATEPVLEPSTFTMPHIRTERRSKSQHHSQARALIDKIFQLRSGTNFGQAPTIESVLTSFFVSLALYNLDEGGNDWKDASFFRFCEAVTLAKIARLDRAEAGEEEAIKVGALLVRAERWWAEQREGYVCQMEDHRVVKKRSVSDDDRDDFKPKRPRTTSPRSDALSFLVKLGFGHLRDDLLYRFRPLIECLTLTCPPHCPTLTATSAIRIHDTLATLSHPAADPILIDLARQTLRAQLWTSCAHHHLVSPHADAPLRPDQPLHIALDTLDLLEDLEGPLAGSRGEAVREAVETVRGCVAGLPGGPWEGTEFEWEHIDDEGEDGGRGGGGTTVGRAAQSVVENLQRFLQPRGAN